MANCCESGKSLNTGTPKQSLFGPGSRLFVQFKTADDGTENGIDLSTWTGSQVQWDALTNNVDASKRLYPIGDFKNVEDVKGDSVFETFNDTSNLFVQEGTRTWTGVLPNKDTVFLGKLKGYGCRPLRVYISDNCDALHGEKSDTTADLFVGVDVDQNTWNAIFEKATDTTNQKNLLSFEFARTSRDENLRQILSDEMTVKPKDVDGLIDVNVAISGESTTGFVGVATFDYGSCLNPLKFTGALAGDWTLFNEDSGLPVVITTADEGPDGTYTFVYPAQLTTEVLTLTLTKTGFDLATTTITTP